MTLYQFMSDSPFLTFFLAYLAVWMIVNVVRALRGLE